MNEWAQKRFWTSAKPAETDGGYTVELDARPIRTPNKSPFVLPTLALAQAIAREWDAQEEKLDPLSMPLTRMANSAIDKVAPQQAEVAALLADYGRTDLLCYRAEQPAPLIQRQAEAWDPMLEWAANHLGVRLNVGAGVMFVPQNEEHCRRLAEPLVASTNFQLAALHDLISLTGSLVLGLAATTDSFKADALWQASRVDETWQQEQWGKDEEAIEMAAAKERDFKNAHKFYRLVEIEQA